MKLLGRELSQKEFIIVPAVTLGVGLIGYALYKKISYIYEDTISGDEDLNLPLTLEHEYGDFRATYFEADVDASDYLNELPERYFHFTASLSSFILTRFSNQVKLRRALILGSSTAGLAFELSKVFTEVKGVERSFTNVVTSFKFQNGTDVNYFFPLEGSHRTKYKILKHNDIFHKFMNEQRNALTLDNVQIVNSDPCGRLSTQNDLFQVVVFFSISATLHDFGSALVSISRFIEVEGYLFIVTDYAWPRVTNRHLGFDDPSVTSSFELFKMILESEFTLEEEKSIMDVKPSSLRSCTLVNFHVTAWRRNTGSEILSPHSHNKTELVVEN